MSYDSEIHLIYDRLKADKAVTQPWRNKAIARLQEAQAFIRMGQTTANIGVDKMAPASGDPTAGIASQCTCTLGVLDNSCPIHGTPAMA